AVVVVVHDAIAFRNIRPTSARAAAVAARRASAMAASSTFASAIGNNSKASSICSSFILARSHEHHSAADSSRLATYSVRLIPNASADLLSRVNSRRRTRSASVRTASAMIVTPSLNVILSRQCDAVEVIDDNANVSKLHQLHRQLLLIAIADRTIVEGA